MVITLKYLIVIETGDNNCGAFSPDVPGCVTTGKTIEQTIRNMKNALRFHLSALEAFPEAKGLKYHMEAGVFSENEIEPGYLITEVQIRMKEKEDRYIEGVHGRSVTFKVIARPKDYVEPKPNMKVVKKD